MSPERFVKGESERTMVPPVDLRNRFRPQRVMGLRNRLTGRIALVSPLRGLRRTWAVHPALPRWAKLWRASGAWWGRGMTIFRPRKHRLRWAAEFKGTPTEVCVTRSLFVAEGDDGVYLGGAAGWEVAGQGGYGG